MTTPAKQLRNIDPIIGNPPMWDTSGKYRPYFYLSDLFMLTEKSLVEAGLPLEAAEGEIIKSSWGPEYLRLLDALTKIGA